MAECKAALVVGAGEATGGAIARRFAREGYTACVTRRNADKLRPLVERIEAAGGKARAFGSDARREEQVVELVRHDRARGRADRGLRVQRRRQRALPDPRDDRARLHQGLGDGGAWPASWSAREAAKVMVPRGRGTILFTGATASLRGGKGFAAFAGAKHALRALAQSMARELGPEGIHVAHVVIDGAIDTPFIREHLSGALCAEGPRRASSTRRRSRRTTGSLHRQPRSAWTHELDLRPWLEPW